MLFVSKTHLHSFFICRHIILLFRICCKCTTFNYFCKHFFVLFKKLAEKLAENSPKTRPPQSLVALRLKVLFFSIWHSALKRGVVVAPQILDFFFEKIPQISLTFKTKKDPFRSFFRYQGSLQPEAEGSPTPDTLLYPLSYPFPVARR